MKHLSLLLCLLLTGCNWYDLRGRPILQKGEAKEEQTIKQKSDLETEILIQTEPTDKPGPITTYDFYDRKVKLPSNAKAQFIVTSDYSSKQTDWYKLIGQFNYKSGMGQLIFIGALCIAGGAVLCYFGMWSIGIGLAIFGFLLIACGIAIEQYPWLFVCVLFLGLIGVVAFVIYSIRNKKLATANMTTESVLAEICSKIEALKKVNPELVKQFITDELKKSDISGTIKKVVSKVKGV